MQDQWADSEHLRTRTAGRPGSRRTSSHGSSLARSSRMTSAATIRGRASRLLTTVSLASRGTTLRSSNGSSLTRLRSPRAQAAYRPERHRGPGEPDRRGHRHQRRREQRPQAADHREYRGFRGTGRHAQDGGHRVRDHAFGNSSGEQMAVTVTKVISDASPSDSFEAAPAGDRLYAVQFRLADTGSAPTRTPRQTALPSSTRPASPTSRAWRPWPGARDSGERRTSRPGRQASAASCSRYPRRRRSPRCSSPSTRAWGRTRASGT